MGFELPDGKTARNLQDQVKFLSEKLKDLYAAFNESGLKKIEIVEELPEVGEPTVLYLLARQDPEQDDYYEEYLWYDNQWEKIGTTQIDLSDYCTLSTDQTITGIKTINNELHICNGGAGLVYGLKIKNNGWSSEIQQESGAGIQFSGVAVQPTVDNQKDLGAQYNRWKDLYLSGTLRLNGIPFYKGGTVVYAGATLAPDNNTSDLGTSSFPYKDLYLNGQAKINDNSGAQSGVIVKSKPDGGTITAFSLMLESDYLYTYTIRPYSDNLYDSGSANQAWKNIYCKGRISDGKNLSYGLVIPDTTSWSDNKTISTVVIKQHSVVCANGTLTILTNYVQSATSGSTVSAACSVALSLKWNGYPALYCSGTVVHYYDYADLTIKSASLGTINSDTITDY